jgi:hypothetical protein
VNKPFEVLQKSLEKQTGKLKQFASGALDGMNSLKSLASDVSAAAAMASRLKDLKTVEI